MQAPATGVRDVAINAAMCPSGIFRPRERSVATVPYGMPAARHQAFNDAWPASTISCSSSSGNRQDTASPQEPQRVQLEAALPYYSGQTLRSGRSPGTNLESENPNLDLGEGHKNPNLDPHFAARPSARTSTLIHVVDRHWACRIRTQDELDRFFDR